VEQREVQAVTLTPAVREEVHRPLRMVLDETHLHRLTTKDDQARIHRSTLSVRLHEPAARQLLHEPRDVLREVIPHAAESATSLALGGTSGIVGASRSSGEYAGSYRGAPDRHSALCRDESQEEESWLGRQPLPVLREALPELRHGLRLDQLVDTERAVPDLAEHVAE
jgi:hypothetical protein